MGRAPARHAGRGPAHTSGLAALQQAAAYWGIDRMLISISRSMPPLLPDTEDCIRTHFAEWASGVQIAT